MKIRVYFVGKPRDGNANAMAAEYVKRASRYAGCEMREIDPRRGSPWAKQATAHKVALDPAGKMVDSAGFAALFEKLEMEGRDVVFAIGGHDGIPEVWRKEADQLLSLSPLTFPHELARAILAEQVYRALTMLRGPPYPR